MQEVDRISQPENRGRVDVHEGKDPHRVGVDAGDRDLRHRLGKQSIGPQDRVTHLDRLPDANVEIRRGLGRKNDALRNPAGRPLLDCRRPDGSVEVDKFDQKLEVVVRVASQHGER